MIRNMPGAGGIKAANFIYSIAPQDGTAWGFITRGFVRAPLLQTPQADFDPTKYHWIGTPSQETTVAAVWAAGTRVRSHARRHERGSGVRRHLARDRHRPVPDHPQPADRHAFQGRGRLQEQHRRRHRDGARRGAGQDLDLGLAQERPHRRPGWPKARSRCWRSSACGRPRICPTCRWCSTSPRAPRTARSWR